MPVGFCQRLSEVTREFMLRDPAKKVLAPRSFRDENERIALAIILGDTATDRLDESAMDFFGCLPLVWARVVESAQIRRKSPPSEKSVSSFDS
jgi:hypothetical protein